MCEESEERLAMSGEHGLPVPSEWDGEGEDPEADATTGASPGTAQACDDLGLNSLEANLSRFNIKPPGVA